MKKKQLERGQSFVELAIGMTILIMLLGGLFDLGRSFFILIAVENATGEGAIYAAAHPECLTTDHDPAMCQDANNESIQARVREEGEPMVTMTSTNSQIDVVLENQTANLSGSTVRVDVTYTFTPVTPIGFMIWGNTATVEASSRQRIFAPPAPGYNN